MWIDFPTKKSHAKIWPTLGLMLVRIIFWRDSDKREMGRTKRERDIQELYNKDRNLRDSPSRNKEVRRKRNEYKWRLGHLHHNWMILYSKDYLPLNVLGPSRLRSRPCLLIVGFLRANKFRLETGYEARWKGWSAFLLSKIKKRNYVFCNFCN